MDKHALLLCVQYKHKMYLRPCQDARQPALLMEATKNKGGRLRAEGRRPGVSYLLYFPAGKLL